MVVVVCDVVIVVALVVFEYFASVLDDISDVVDAFLWCCSRCGGFLNIGTIIFIAVCCLDRCCCGICLAYVGL